MPKKIKSKVENKPKVIEETPENTSERARVLRDIRADLSNAEMEMGLENLTWPPRKAASVSMLARVVVILLRAQIHLVVALMEDEGGQ